VKKSRNETRDQGLEKKSLAARGRDGGCKNDKKSKWYQVQQDKVEERHMKRKHTRLEAAGPIDAFHPSGYRPT